MFSKEEICHIKMIALLLFHFFFSGKPWTIFTSAWLNISKKTRKNEGIYFLKEEICHVKMISFTFAWLNFSKETRKNEGEFFQKKEYVI